MVQAACNGREESGMKSVGGERMDTPQHTHSSVGAAGAARGARGHYEGHEGR